ncbi:MAG: amine dehydrogenase large subunit [Gammaproteobacteria bacterium]
MLFSDCGKILSILCLAAALVSDAAAAGNTAPRPDLPPLHSEATGRSATLPQSYPKGWFLVQDMAFHHMLDGRVILIDPTARTEPEQFKGMFNNSLIGNIAVSRKRHEIYSVETFYSRGNRGKRTDVVTIYDTRNLSPVGEVVYPKPKRFMGMPERYALVPIDNDRLLLSFNLTPATSVSVINLDTRKIVNNVEISGCTFVYPTGKRGFTSICADGGLLTTQLDSNGQTVKQTRIKPFFDTNTAPVFERPAIVNGTAYFFGFAGTVRPVDVSGPVASVGKPWQLVPKDQRGDNWRPGGIAIVDTDTHGHFYLLMHPGGHEGTQNEPGTEVWVYNAASHKRVSRIKLKTPALSVTISGSDRPLLLASNVNSTLDLYDANTGKWIRTIDGMRMETPFMAYGIK